MIRRLQVGTLAVFTFREAVRKRVVPAAIGLTILLIVLFGVGIHFVVAEFDNSPRTLPSVRSAAIAQILLTGLWLGSFLSGLLAIFVSVGTVASEIEAGTLQGDRAEAPGALGNRRWKMAGYRRDAHHPLRSHIRRNDLYRLPASRLRPAPAGTGDRFDGASSAPAVKYCDLWQHVPPAVGQRCGCPDTLRDCYDGW